MYSRSTRVPYIKQQFSHNVGSHALYETVNNPEEDWNKK
jgi:hypothetical protein